MQRGPTVFVVQDNHPRDKTPKDWTPALQHGTLEFLLPSTITVLQGAPAVRMMKETLLRRGFSDQDFILMAGDPVAIGIACSLAAEMNGGRYTALRWDRRETRYYPVPVNVRAAA